MKVADCNVRPTLKALFLSFLRLGLTAFGGPAMIAYIREISVGKKRWLDEETFRDGVAICQSIPGATAMQMAAYVGLKARGIPGAILTYTGFGLPAFLLMVLFSSVYAASRNLAQVLSLFHGLQVIVVAIVAGASYSFGRSIVRSYPEGIMAAAAAALFAAGTSPFIVIVAAAAAGVVLKRNIHPVSQDKALAGEEVSYRQIALILVVVFSVLAVLYFADRRLFSLAALMLRVDLFAFGGGFASLPLMLHEVVDVKGWLDSRTFMDGIALGQVTPGPIVITSTFVGYLTQGLAGALTATVAMFTPSFIVLTSVTPVFFRLKSSPVFLRAVQGILASFVGLLFFVTVKFAMAVPWDAIRILLGISAFAALARKVDILYVVLAGSVVSLLFL